MAFALLRTLTNPTSFFIALGSSALIFDAYFLLMQRLPATADNMCIIGGNLTTENILFAVFMSITAGILIAGTIMFAKQQRLRKSIASTSLSGFGVLIGSLGVFCTVCTLPVISLFGASFSLSLFAEHSTLLKAISILLMLLGIFILNKKLSQSCNCK